MWLSLSVQSRKPTSPISSGFSDRYFSLAAPMCHLDFPDQIVKSPQILSHVPLHGEGYPGAPLLSDKVCGKFRRCTAREVTLPPGAPRYRQQQGDTRPSVLREPCRSPLQATTGRHAAVRSPRAVSLPVTGNNRETRGRPFSATRVAPRYRQQQGDTRSVLRELCRFPVKGTTLGIKREKRKSHVLKW